MNYQLVVHSKALKDIQKLSAQQRIRVKKKIDSLSIEPRPNGYRKLKNFHSPRRHSIEYFRIRVGDIRVIYTIEEEVITVTVVKVQKRGDIY